MDKFNYELCKTCNHEVIDCDSCDNNIKKKGYYVSDNQYPCGQFHCWYGCTVCENCGGCNYQGYDDIKKK